MNNFGDEILVEDVMVRKGSHYCCDLCSYSTQSIIRMKEHNKMHSWNEEFRCPRCTYSAKKPLGIDFHLKKDHLDATSRRDDSLPKQSRAEVAPKLPNQKRKSNRATRFLGPFAETKAPAVEG